MKLVSFSIRNYRSITTAYKIILDQYTVLVGKNNEGKSNILHALDLAMNILINHSGGRLRRVREYLWENDFPVQIQDRAKDTHSVFRLEFKLNETELVEFHNEIGSWLNGNIAIEIKIGADNNYSISVPKRGKNATSLTSKSNKIASFISQRISINYIPAIRTAQNAMNEIRNTIADELEALELDENYQKAVLMINLLQKGILDKIAQNITEPLKTFIPSIKKVEIVILEDLRRHTLRRDIDVIVDDGNATSICL